MLGETRWGSWRPAVLGAAVAAVLVMSFPVMAAVGGNLVLGQANSADAMTSLSGAATTNLRVTNTQAGSPALDLRVAAGSPPLKVNSTTRVANLNADRLDGKHGSAYLPVGGKAADSALLDGRQLSQVRPFVSTCSSADVSGGLLMCQIEVEIPSAGTLIFSGSVDAEYTGFAETSVLVCYFLIDGWVETETYRHAVLTPAEKYGFCASEGHRSDLSVGTHTMTFYTSSSDSGETPLGSASAEWLFVPSS